MTADVALVACSKMKVEDQVAAKNLYSSPLFKMSRSYAERNARRSFILSAEHGLLHPETATSPYDTTLNRMAAAGRREWVKRVIEQMTAQDVRGTRLLVLAGKVYRSGLMQFLWTRFDEICHPDGWTENWRAAELALEEDELMTDNIDLLGKTFRHGVTKLNGKEAEGLVWRVTSIDADGTLTAECINEDTRLSGRKRSGLDPTSVRRTLSGDVIEFGREA